jgi:hypothetical protein
LQGSLQLHERFKVMSDRCGKQKKSIDVLKMEKAKVDKTVEELQQKNMALEKELLEVKAERDRHAQESTEARAEVDEQRACRCFGGTIDVDCVDCNLQGEGGALPRISLRQSYKWDVAMMQEMIDTYMKR